MSENIPDSFDATQPDLPTLAVDPDPDGPGPEPAGPDDVPSDASLDSTRRTPLEEGH